MLCVGPASRGQTGERTTATLHWNGLCEEVVSSPSPEVRASWLEVSLGGHRERTPRGLDWMTLGCPPGCQQLFKALGCCLASAQDLRHGGASQSVTVTMAQTHLSHGPGKHIEFILTRSSNPGTHLPLK